ncbi:hypothetical protein [Kitasatospora sp. NPDC085879]|uniref:hypothetical protein n=1 Tax=Kitasatospora sp. NPDC085879 TaxID=3154769 RepID=UPI003447DC41
MTALAELGEDTSRTRLVLYSAAGFSPDLRAAEDNGELILVAPTASTTGCGPDPRYQAAGTAVPP